ncbi:hypothetical protein Pcac1_g21196 [Phytophthora cactorum]|nr:hypothetical protein Pcac1_g21196 [Phytophthora cactorum]
MSTSMSRPFGLSPRISDEDMSMTWDVDSLDIDDDGPRQTEYKQTGKRRVAQVTKMKLPEDRTLCAIGLDWKEASAPDSSSSSHPSGRPTKKKNLVTKMKNRLPCYFGVQVPMLLKRLWTCRNNRHSKKR